jgi:enterochelin esterase-like enzyme
MGVRHPDLFGHVIAFSVAGRRKVDVPEQPAGARPHFHLAAGTWEVFLQSTTNAAEELKKHNVPATFVTRVAGHDYTMWEDELAAAAVRAFGKEREDP